MSDLIRKENETKEMGSSNSTKYIQSANSLFHFMQEIEYLEEKIETKSLVPRYVDEEAGYYNLPNLINIAYPMVCFCDIKLHKIKPHAKYYGHYAIAFSKKFSIKKGIQPVTYINTDSNYFNKLKQALLESYSDDKVYDGSYETIADSLIYTISYMKPLEGTQKNEPKNFHDEQEWRFIPDMSFTEMPYFLVNPTDNITYKNNLNNALKTISKVKLYFNYEDIQYIFVKEDRDRERLTNKILDLNISDIEKHLLISKIMVFSTLEGDL